MIKELNLAYAVLRDPANRSAYDRTTFVTTTSPPPKAAAQSPPTGRTNSPPPQPASPPRAHFPPLASGSVAFAVLPNHAKQRLRSRYQGSVPQQFKTPLARVSLAWIVAVGCLAGCILWIVSAGQERWQNSDPVETLTFIGALAGVPFFLSVFHIVRWRSSPLKRMLYITPLYVVETRYHSVRYWPVWSLTNISATHRYYNQAYTGTDVVMTFGKDVHSFRVRGQILYQQLVDALRVFTDKCFSAAFQNDYQYFRNEDDFQGAVPSTRQQGRTSWGSALFAFVAAGVLVLSTTGMSFWVNQYAPKAKPISLGTNNSLRRPGQTNRNTNFDPSTAVAVPSLSPYDRSTDPPNGYVFRNQLRTGHGTLKIINGTSYHAVAKLVSTVTNKSVFTVFVSAGDQYTIRNIPNATFKLAFASGRRWNVLTDGFDEFAGVSIFRNSMTFDTTTAVEGDQEVTYYHTMEVTLQPVAGGNARTDRVEPNVFEQF